MVASFNYPYGIAVDNSGNLYVADTDNNRIRKLNPIPTIYDSQLFRKEYLLVPNPTMSFFKIVIDQATQIEVINSIGQIVFTRKINEGTSTISTASLESGIYRILAEGYKPTTLIISK
jgi:DNA-binding beta-propeller fold protein YncE